jgi:hypothetical protein
MTGGCARRRAAGYDDIREVNIAKFWKVVGWLFVVAALALFILPWALPFWISKEATAAWKDRLSLASSGVVAAGLLTTLGALLLSKSHEAGEAAERRSLFYLESCNRAYEEAWALLKDGNNERAKWIAAARALTHANLLSAKVTSEAHFKVLEVYRLKYRRLFSELIRGKPAASFYGVNDTSAGLDDAARASSAGESREGGLRVTSVVRRLSEESLHIVWEAAQWLESYLDPLDNHRFSEDEIGRLMLLTPELHRFIQHTRRFDTASGKLWDRAKDQSA